MIQDKSVKKVTNDCEVTPTTLSKWKHELFCSATKSTIEIRYIHR